MPHPAEQSEPLLVLRWTSTSSGILPVQIQTIKAMSPQEPDARLDEPLTVGSIGHHDGKPSEDKRLLQLSSDVHKNLKNYLIALQYQ